MTVQRLLLPVAACVLLLAACGGQRNTPAVPVQQGVVTPSPAAIQCGTVPAAGGSPHVVVQQGKIGCDEAKSLLTQYFAKLSPADLASPDGAGPIAIGPWTCGSNPAAPLAAACSTEDDRQVSAAP